jgi:hypothetical protein
MANASIYDGNPPGIAGRTPFGIYDNDAAFVANGPKVANFVARKLGYPVMDVELDYLNIYACYEEAVSVYSQLINQLSIQNNLLSLIGSPTGSNLNNQVVVPTLNSVVDMADAYGSLIGVGGQTEWYTGSLMLTASQQVYDLQSWGISNGYIQQGDRIVIDRIFYESNPAINQYYDPYIGGSINYQGATENFGWASYSPGLNFTLFPVYWDIQRIQEIEMSNQVRRSAFTFEIVNNKLRIFPIPEITGVPLRIQYSKKSEMANPSLNSPYSTSTALVTNPSNVPYTVLAPSQINGPGQNWIFEYTLALCMELLGLIRNKYTTVPIPGAETTLNGADLSNAGREMQSKLKEQLKADLTELSRPALLEKQSQENQSIQDTLTKVPLFIYIGSYLVFMINTFLW